MIRHVEDLLQCYFEQEPAYELSLRSHLLAVFYIAINQDILTESNLKENSSTMIVRNALSYMNKNYSNRINIRDLASGFGITPEYFCRIFKTSIGKRPLEYIIEYRVAQSRGMLANTQDSVTAIAAYCGFDDINYFSRCFKRIYGITPIEYRKNL